MARKIEVLQAGRALAALTVVFHHANEYNPVSGWLVYGYRAVDFFFVLSGFIIYHANVGREFDPRRYAFSRAKRIYVPYLPIGLAMAAWLAVAGRQSWNWLATLTLAPIGSPALPVAWTLQHEMLFYVLAGIFFYLRRPLAGVMAWAALIVLQWLTGLFGAEASRIILNPINLEFVVGMCLAALYEIRPFPEIPIGKTLSFLGGASYSIYLAHVPVLAVAYRLGLGFATSVILAVGAALLYHIAVERPLQAGAFRRFAPFRRQASVAGE